jgi:hypothetical protein
MVIALERYLIPMISKNHKTSYHLALVRICTTLTKGWFRQFAIDNYPRLSNLDKDLLSIAHDIVDSHPLQQEKSRVWTPDVEIRAIFDSINPHTESISSLLNNLGDPIDVTRSGFKITSPVNGVSITAIITEIFTNWEDQCPYADWSVSVAIFPSEDLKILR